MIMNPPSAWAVAKRDAPKVAERCWTHGFAAGPKGRFAPFVPYFWSIWNFSKNQMAAKSLIMHLSQPEAVEQMVVASGGYDLPSFEKLTTFKIWQDEGPPTGTLNHYPNITTPTRTITRSCRSPARRRRTASASASIRRRR
jgi:ABC-type glycerol-3-phosphate transport system substrate-binding protein